MRDRPPLLERRGLIKICGISDPAGMEAALTAGADMIGLVFVKASPRAVTPAAAAALAGQAAGGPSCVGLFQNAEPAEIAAVRERVPLDLIQLHGGESPADVEIVKDLTGLPVIKAIGIGGPADLRRAAEYPADILILDAAPPQGAGAAGGHGARFDWALLAKAPATPWLLAGGLTPDNVAKAVLAAGEAPGFTGVDVSSGVEAAKGLKDPRRIIRFVAAARAAMARRDEETFHG